MCDQRAVEAASDSRLGNGGSMSPASSIGEREHGRTPNEGKESRRRQT
jgi:hypothetical protein